jgi:signal transduction histidine kinase
MAASGENTPKPAPDPSSPHTASADRLLACFRKAFNHELPNHLVAIQGLLQVLRLDEADRLSPEGRACLERVIAAADRAHDVVRTLAAIGRAGQDRTPAGAVPLAEVVREAVAEVKLLYSTRSIEYDLSDPLSSLWLPRAPLRHVLVQLLHNAIQATADNPAPRLAIGARTSAGGQEFWVADNGRGLSAPRQEQLEAFCSGQEPAPPGSGLGLVLVCQIVASWGGTLHVRSLPGQGAVFTVSVPAAWDGEAAGEGPVVRKTDASLL